MEILDTILSNVPIFVDMTIKDKGNDSIKYIFDTYITKCININFDSKFFYLTRDIGEIGFEIDHNMTTEFLRMLIRLIETRSMNENIKNSSNRIHFRVYKHNVLLDSKNNEIRKAIVVNLVKKMGSDVVLKYMLDKRCSLLNSRNSLNSDTDEWCENEVFIYRSNIIIESILKHIAPTYLT